MLLAKIFLLMSSLFNLKIKRGRNPEAPGSLMETSGRAAIRQLSVMGQSNKWVKMALTSARSLWGDTKNLVPKAPVFATIPLPFEAAKALYLMGPNAFNPRHTIATDTNRPSDSERERGNMQETFYLTLLLISEIHAIEQPGSL